MTILSKKKTSNKQNEEPTETSSHNGNSSLALQNSVTLETGESHGLQHPQYSRTPNTPPHHMLPSASSSSREEMRSSHGSSPHYDDLIENQPTVGKRRHRASPHRCEKRRIYPFNADSATRWVNIHSSGMDPATGQAKGELQTSQRTKHRERVNSPPSACHMSTVQHPGVASRPSPARPPTPSAGPSGTSYLDEASGYNSEDEYGMVPSLNEKEWAERDRRFEKKLRKKGWIIKKMGEDGACLFRAVADQIFGDQEMHSIVRNQCMDFLSLNKDHYKQYMTEDLDAYVTRKRNDFVHGNHIELQALSEMFNRAIEVFSYGIEPITIFHGQAKPDNEPIRLSYHRGVHYNSIVDPYKATIGVGLGLPNFTPGLAEKNLMKEAVRQSEESEIEQAMLEDKLMATDWEATYEVMTEQAARESYLQWLKDNEKRNKAMHRASASATTSSTITSADCRSARSGMNQRTCDRSPETSVKQDMMFPKLCKDMRCSPNCTCNKQLNLQLPMPQTMASPHQMSSKPMEEISENNASSSKTCPSLPLSCIGCPLNSCNCKISLNSMPCTMKSCSPLSSSTSTSSENQIDYLNYCQAGPSSSCSSTSTELRQTNKSYSFLDQVPPEMLGLSSWENDAKLLAEALAASQEEYLDSLKRSSKDDQSSLSSQSSSS